MSLPAPFFWCRRGRQRRGARRGCVVTSTSLDRWRVQVFAARAWRACGRARTWRETAAVTRRRRVVEGRRRVGSAPVRPDVRNAPRRACRSACRESGWISTVRCSRRRNRGDRWGCLATCRHCRAFIDSRCVCLLTNDLRLTPHPVGRWGSGGQPGRAGSLKSTPCARLPRADPA